MSAPGDLYHETWCVVGPFTPDECIDWRRRIAAPGLRPFLQHRLSITHVAVEGAEGIVPVTLHKPPRRLGTAIEIERRDDRFAGTREDRGLSPPAAARLGIGEDQLIRQPCQLRCFGA